MMGFLVMGEGKGEVVVGVVWGYIECCRIEIRSPVGEGKVDWRREQRPWNRNNAQSSIAKAFELVKIAKRFHSKSIMPTFPSLPPRG